VQRPRTRRVLEQEARVNRRRAWVFGVGVAFGIGTAPFVVVYNPGATPWVAMYEGALAALLLWALGQLSSYEESYHEFHDTYINVGHNYAWPAYTAYHATIGVGLTNFMVVEFGAAVVWALMCLVTDGAIDMTCGLLCLMAAFIAWFFSSSLRLHWY
jgi:hypothetical protein